MEKKILKNFIGMNKDLTPDKVKDGFYYEANNIRLNSNADLSLGNIQNEKGNTKRISIENLTLSGSLLTINYKDSSDDTLDITTTLNSTKLADIGTIGTITNIQIVNSIFTGTDNIFFVNFTSSKIFTCVMKMDSSYELSLLFISKNNLISKLDDIKFYYEAPNIQKIYWTNTDSQVKFLNIADSDINKLDAYIEIVPDVTFSNITVTNGGVGGTHTAGLIQYAYSLYFKYGQTTTISPLSQLIPLVNSDGKGGDVNDIVGQINKVVINSINTDYDGIKLYSLKYNTKTSTPIISLLSELEITSNSLTFYDDNTIINEISIEEFQFLGGTIIKPKTIEIKDNRLFVANFKEESWDINVGLDINSPNYYDTRAYRADSSGVRKIKNLDGNYETIDDSFNISGNPVPITHDCIAEHDIYKYAYGTTVGAKGKNLTIEFGTSQASTKEAKSNLKLLKEGEIYRFGIEFINSKGLKSSAHWICDLKVPTGINVVSPLDYHKLIVTLETTTKSKLIAQDVVGYNILRVERTDSNKTMLGQAIVSTMIVQGSYSDLETPTLRENTLTVASGDYAGKKLFYMNRELASKNLIKTPSPFLRSFYSYSRFDSKLSIPFSLHMAKLSGTLYTPLPTQDSVYSADTLYNYTYGELLSNRSVETVQTYMYTKMWQLYSPDIEYSNSPNSFNSVKLSHIVAGDTFGATGYEKYLSGVTTQTASVVNEYKITSIFQDYDNGIITLSGGESMDKITYTTQFDRNYSPNNNIPEISIYGSPQKNIKGESVKYYNNEPTLKYTNSLKTITDDGAGNTITSIYSDANNNVVIIPIKPGATNNSNPVNHYALEEFFKDAEASSSYIDSTVLEKYNFAGYAAKPLGVIVDMVKTLSNQYGGNTYEARSLNTYLTIGAYNNITSQSPVFIEEAGDIYVQEYKFLRLGTDNQDFLDKKYIGHNEIISFWCETSINLNARNDLLRNYTINNINLPTFDSCSKYNTVYHREANYFKAISNPFTLDVRKEFPSTIRASKLKIAGELTDSFTDILVNEENQTNGKYGEIIKLSELTDYLYAFQERGVSFVSINPRVQTSGSDGIPIQLGTGQVLDKIFYLSTVSGVKWNDRNSIFKSPSGLYFYDRNNASLNKLTREGIKGISTEQGMNSYIVSIPDSSEVFGIYDFIKDDAIFTIGDKTLMFNELFNNFTSFYNISSLGWDNNTKSVLSYINNSNKAQVYTHYDNPLYNTFYGVKYPSSITLFINPEQGLVDCRFDNLEWRSNLELDNPTTYMYGSTFDKLKVDDSFQTTGEVSINPINRFGIWRTSFPRANNGKPTSNRLRSPWIKVQLILDANSDKKFNLYDIIVSYAPIVIT